MYRNQDRLVTRIKQAGFVIKKAEMIGKKVWITAERLYVTEKNPNGHVFLDESLYGTIGPRGKLNLTYSQFTHRSKITQPWQLRARLDERKPKAEGEPTATNT